MEKPLVPTDADVAFYRANGYLVIPDVFSPAEVKELRGVTDDFVERASRVEAHDGVYDLEDSHRRGNPRVRRIKTPHLHDPLYAAAARHPGVLAVLSRLIGPSIRFDTGKLNLKSAGYGAPVEWHQDWAFYPHTNDDLAAVGIMLDDVDEANGPLLVVPGTHLGPTYDHHAEGRFCGAMDIARSDLDLTKAVPLLGRAGSITVHHARLVHGSATNGTNRPRRRLLYQYAAADAWPLKGVGDYDRFHADLLTGEEPEMPRIVATPVRMPYPEARNGGSIYENQKGTARRYFATTGHL
ncbi:MAG: phytanoyl-CoA dioxygenase family protein [Alphaproteobacteria bacterium]|nr:phytanoyl-CoA dioxygenase family protein [Alphaproteobacteria bacterium]